MAPELGDLQTHRDVVDEHGDLGRRLWATVRLLFEAAPDQAVEVGSHRGRHVDELARHASDSEGDRGTRQGSATLEFLSADTLRLTAAGGSPVSEATLSVPISPTHDTFVIELLTDEDGALVLNLWGYGGDATADGPSADDTFLRLN